MVQQTLKNLKSNFLFFLELQLLISIVMLPILIAWGLPISIMSIIGNLIFTQILTAFIFISALLFTTDLLGISNHYCILILEWITHVWHTILSYGSAEWLVGFSVWLLPISLLCAFAACMIYHKAIKNQLNRLFLLIILCAITPCIHYLCNSRLDSITIYNGLQKMHIIKINDKIYAFDCGALGARPSVQSWIEYTLTSTMLKTIGTLHIDTLFLCKSNSRTSLAAQILMEHIPTNHCITIQQNNIKLT